MPFSGSYFRVSHRSLGQAVLLYTGLGTTPPRRPLPFILPGCFPPSLLAQRRLPCDLIGPSAFGEFDAPRVTAFSRNRVDIERAAAI